MAMATCACASATAMAAVAVRAGGASAVQTPAPRVAALAAWRYPLVSQSLSRRASSTFGNAFLPSSPTATESLRQQQRRAVLVRAQADDGASELTEQAEKLWKELQAKAGSGFRKVQGSRQWLPACLDPGLDVNEEVATAEGILGAGRLLPQGCLNAHALEKQRECGPVTESQGGEVPSHR
ncbi:hypothetical protein CBR_g3547 [Chara braunii]|uniref:Plastid lipid-associated protein/fibrillin conserved domain-containing protein n=1 Tax=Chara braunii TaxID=69332 RepID=A0A388KFV5_CHABU|nr:hypothetical protein CBR_g3547 [Chara braunii]|eukprot:GBG68853.1 hypothetical protein CBR_g3547 [Chara braunii]